VDAIQWVVFAAKIQLLHVRRAEQVTVEGVGPTVVGALDTSLEVALGGRTNAGAAMATDVEEGLHAAGCIACDNDAFTGDLAQNVVAGTWDFRLAAGIHPHLRVKAVHLFAEYLRVGVVALRKCSG